MTSGGDIELQVLICTCGSEGINRVANGIHPRVPKVEYLVSWQNSNGLPLPESLERTDFRIVRAAGKGLSKNRNTAFAHSTAPLILISDDDLDYTVEGLENVIESFRRHPETDIITFQYDSVLGKKNYPDHSFSLATPAKGYFVTSFEIALRRKSIFCKVWFNENFGIGAPFPSGEEDVFLQDCLNVGLTGIFLPVTIMRHDGTTTSERNLMLASRPETKGAVFLHLHPRDWFLRMIAHTIREIPMWRKGVVPSPFSYCLNWLKGARRAKKSGLFPTPDYSSRYLADRKD
ncbi:MAG: glycosyltransferase [Candidatus Amulumruptor caecigallinarius]|nr:glycosyltransferase [Candidatus Amulumruptor caecigallinarius]